MPADRPSSQTDLVATAGAKASKAKKKAGIVFETGPKKL